MIAMDTQKNTNNDGVDSGGKVDQGNSSTWAVGQQTPPPRHPSEDKPWLFKPGQSGNPAGKQSLNELTKNFRVALLDKHSKRAAEIAGKWLESNDPFVQKLYFEYIVGKPKVQAEVTGMGENNIELMRSAMKAFNRLQELEAENARIKAELEGKTIEHTK